MTRTVAALNTERRSGTRIAPRRKRFMVSVLVLSGNGVAGSCTPHGRKRNSIASHPAMGFSQSKLRPDGRHPNPIGSIELLGNKPGRTKRFSHAVVRHFDEWCDRVARVECERGGNPRRTDGPTRAAEDAEVVTADQGSKRVAQPLFIRSLGDFQAARNKYSSHSALGFQQRGGERKRALSADVLVGPRPFGKRVTPGLRIFDACRGAPLSVVGPTALRVLRRANEGVARLKLGTVERQDRGARRP